MVMKSYPVGLFSIMYCNHCHRCCQTTRRICGGEYGNITENVYCLMVF